MTYFSNFPLENQPRKKVGLIGFDGFATADLTGPLEAFAAARDTNGDAGYETILIGVVNPMFVSASGAMFKGEHTLATAPPLDTIIIPGGANLPGSQTSKLLARWLRERGASARRIAAVSTGIYPLAGSGLLDGRHVTTHWRFAQHLASTFRALQVSDSGSFIKDGKFYTCGGGTAGVEMALALIEEDCGAPTALRLARELVVSLRPPGGDERYLSPTFQQCSSEERLADLPAWITRRLRDDLSVGVLARRAALCPRHFSRVFRRRFNLTPAEFVERVRISEAARLLATRTWSVKEVADSVGYHNVDVFRRAFERRYGLPPKKFQKASSATPSRRKRHIRRRFRKLPGRV